MLPAKSAGLLMLVAFATLASAPAEAPKLESFYIVRTHFSDLLPTIGQVVTDWARLLDVAPVAGGVRVRLSRFTSAIGCKEEYVEAVERVIPRTNVASIVGVDLCAIDEKKAQSVLDRSRKKGGWQGDDDTFVAVCQDKVRVLNLLHGYAFNTNALRSHDHALAEIIDTFTRVRDSAFGPGDPFAHAGSNPGRDQQKVAAAVVADLAAGRFKEGRFTANRRYLVTDPPTTNTVVSAQLLEADTLRFASYRPALPPPIALLAQVFGDVHLRLTVVPATGVMTDVAVVSGPPLLTQAATDAAHAWRLTPGSAMSEQIDVTLRFQLNCEKD